MVSEFSVPCFKNSALFCASQANISPASRTLAANASMAEPILSDAHNKHCKSAVIGNTSVNKLPKICYVGFGSASQWSHFQHKAAASFIDKEFVIPDRRFHTVINWKEDIALTGHSIQDPGTCFYRNRSAGDSPNQPATRANKADKSNDWLSIKHEYCPRMAGIDRPMAGLNHVINFESMKNNYLDCLDRAQSKAASRWTPFEERVTPSSSAE